MYKLDIIALICILRHFVILVGSDANVTAFLQRLPY